MLEKKQEVDVDGVSYKCAAIRDETSVQRTTSTRILERQNALRGMYNDTQRNRKSGIYT